MTDQEIRQQVRKIMYENMISGHADAVHADFHYTRPAAGRYPYQFFWDTCLHIYILVALSITL